MNVASKPASQPTDNGQLAIPVVHSVLNKARRLLRFFDISISAEDLTDSEPMRQARLISCFGRLGAFIGALITAVCLLLGHTSEGLIIIVCSSCFATAPFLIRRNQSIEPTGHLLILILTLGFTALCLAGGGLQGHVIAWLISAPMCALLLLGRKAATRWALITLFAEAAVVTLDLAGIRLPANYDQKWNPILSAAGYFALLGFMFILGLIFETGRMRAFAKMRETLAALAKTNERLVLLNQEKNDFLGIAAHDLKNPLTVILGNARLGGMLEDPKEMHQLLGDISGAALRMNDLIGNLLDVDAIEQGKFASQAEPCDLGVLVEQSVKNNQPGAAKKMINLQFASVAGVWALAAPAATVQILDNLISNALKFSSPHTAVHVTTVAETGYISVAVRDEGPGISEVDQEKLFRKFSRLSARPTGGESSTGLGLAIVKRLAESMCGTIHCQSILGQGATFTLRLPICPPSVEHVPRNL